ncbi:MAG: hypothetical protein GJ680_18075 [Alteromonadaceae bacterium]|nr:hypothetical protein [Alteromonadaceae bacterium]
MPLTALINGDQICASEINSAQWQALKHNHSLTLTMKCCGEAAIAKTSKKGLHFFAHKNVIKECSSAPESLLHMELKLLVADIGKKCGFAMELEKAGTALNGDRWVADVYCNNNAKPFVVEIQCSYQSTTTFSRRHGQYQTSGVRAMWLYDDSVFPNPLEYTAAFPAFAFSVTDDGIRMPQFNNIPIMDFLQALFESKLFYGIGCSEASVSVKGVNHRCHHCEHLFNVPTTLQITSESGLQITEKDTNDDAVIKWLADYLPSRPDIAYYTTSRTRQTGYVLSHFACPACFAPLDKCCLGELIHDTMISASLLPLFSFTTASDNLPFVLYKRWWVSN